MMIQWVSVDLTQLQGEVRQRNQLWRSLQDVSRAAQTLSDQLQADLVRCSDTSNTLTAAHAALQDALVQAHAVLDAVAH